MGVTVGLLDVRMEVLPKPAMGTTIPQTEIGQQLRVEEARDKESAHAFFKYAQRWWSDFTEIHANFKQRCVQNALLAACTFHQL